MDEELVMTQLDVFLTLFPDQFQQISFVLLISFVYFIIKHFYCDFIVQTAYQRQHKHKYGHPGGLIHAFSHCLGSLPYFFIFFHGWAAMGLAVTLLFAEFVVHYHADWIKANTVQHLGFAENDREARWIEGLDQAIHHMTYLGILFVWWH